MVFESHVPAIVKASGSADRFRATSGVSGGPVYSYTDENDGQTVVVVEASTTAATIQLPKTTDENVGASFQVVAIDATQSVTVQAWQTPEQNINGLPASVPVQVPWLVYTFTSIGTHGWALQIGSGSVGVDFMLEVQRGNITGLSVIHKFGANADVDATPDEDVISWGGDLVYPSAAESLEMVSDSTSDDTGGTGCETVTWYGLDGDYNEVTESVDTNGTSAVALTNQMLRTFRGVCGVCGSNGSNVGTITLRVSGGGATRVVIDPNSGQTLMCAYTIPAGSTGYILRFDRSITGVTAADVDFTILSREPGEAWRVRDTKGLKTTGSSSESTTYGVRPALPEKTDVRVRANSDSANVGVTANLDILIDST